MNAYLPTVAVTLGDPAGVGAEVTLKALADAGVRAAAHWILLGDKSALEGAEQTTGIRVPAQVELS